MPNPRLPEEALEPEANFCRDEELCTADQATMLSIAVSLKRIADAIDGTTLGVDISKSLAGITDELRRQHP